MTSYESFLPFVQPRVPTCPRETCLHHIRQAAIEFCERTLVWQEDLDTLLADGFSTSYALALDDQVALSKLLEVWVQDSTTARPVRYDTATPAEGRDAERSGSTGNKAWMLDRATLGIWPAPIVDAAIDVTAALKPSQASYSFPEILFEHHARQIAHGALAELFDLGEWADSMKAATERGKFEDAIAGAARGAEKGNAKRRRCAAERFL